MTDVWKVRRQIRSAQRHPFTKAHGIVAHARRRLGERYGLTISREEYREMCRAILRRDPDKAEMVHQQSKRHSQWILKWRGKVIYCLFDAKYSSILTFFRPEWREKKEPRR